MPVTDPVTDEAIREGLATLRQSSPERAHPHRGSLPHDQPYDAGALPASHREDGINSGSGALSPDAVELYYTTAPAKLPTTQQLPAAEVSGARVEPPPPDPKPIEVVFMPNTPTQALLNELTSAGGKRVLDSRTTVKGRKRSRSQSQSKIQQSQELELAAAAAPAPASEDLARVKPEGMQVIDDSVLEQALLAQWPPIDQINHNRLNSYDRLKKKNEGNKMEMLQKHLKNLVTPSFWIDRRLYKVSASLKNDWRVQGKFFGKIFLLKAIQLLFINLWILTLYLIPSLRNWIIQKHDWIYMALGLFFMMMIVVRTLAKCKADYHPFAVAQGLLLLTLPIAYVLAAVTFKYSATCIPMMSLVLLLTCATLPFVPLLTQSSVLKSAITRTAVVIVVLYSVVILVIVAYAKLVPDLASFATFGWFPGLLMAVVVLWVSIYEVQKILEGFCFDVSEKRWAFAALYA